MKSDFFYDDGVTPQGKQLIKACLEGDNDNFNELTKQCGLNPKTDFRHSDLSGVDFSDSDITNHDFTGACLRGAIAIRTRWDETTIFDQADLSDSMFAHGVAVRDYFVQNDEAAKRFSRLKDSHWLEVSLWLGEAFVDERSAPDREYEALMVASKLFQHTDSSMVRTEVLLYTRNSFPSRGAYRDFLLSILAMAGQDERIALSALRILAATFYNERTVFSAFLKFLGSKEVEVRSVALNGLLNSRLFSSARDEVRASMINEPDESVRRHFVERIARQAGESHERVCRDGVGKYKRVIDFRQKITAKMLLKIAEDWISDEGIDFRNRKSAAAARVPAVRRLLKDLREAGVPFMFK